MPSTAPPPYARYGGVIPPCPQLPAAVAEAQQYLDRAKGWLTSAAAAEAQAKQDLKTAQDLRDGAEKVLEAAVAAQRAGEGNMLVPGARKPTYTTAYQGLVDKANAARTALQKANDAVTAAMASYEAANKERRSMEEMVNRSQEWLGKLKDALANCPPAPKKAPAPFNIWDMPLGGDDTCDGLKQELKSCQDSLGEAKAQLPGATKAVETAEADFQNKVAAAKSAQAAAKSAPGDAGKVAAASSAASDCQAALDAWRKAAAEKSALDKSILDLQERIQSLEAQLAMCGKTAMVPNRRAGVLVGLAALALTVATVVVVLLMGGGPASPAAGTGLAHHGRHGRIATAAQPVPAPVPTANVAGPATAPTVPAPPPTSASPTAAGGGNQGSSVRAFVGGAGTTTPSGGSTTPATPATPPVTPTTTPQTGPTPPTTVTPTPPGGTTPGSGSVIQTTVGPPTVTSVAPPTEVPPTVTSVAPPTEVPPTDGSSDPPPTTVTDPTYNDPSSGVTDNPGPVQPSPGLG